MSTTNKSTKVTAKNKKEYPPQIGFWPAKSGKGFTVGINESVLKILETASLGGRLLLTEVPEEYREDNDKMPVYRVTVFPPNEQTQATANDGL
jgi:hypothetical protein